MTKKFQDRCPGCEKLLREIGTFPAQSRYGHGDLCSECGLREAIEGDFIRELIIARIAELKKLPQRSTQ